MYELYAQYERCRAAARVGAGRRLQSGVGCLIIRIMPTPISEPDGNTRGQSAMRQSARRAHPRDSHGTEQIAGNYFMVNGGVMHLQIINSAMGRICGGIT